jgi:CHAD domain-containing protein
MHERLEEWVKLAGRCRRKPTRKRVHALRVVTLRLQAELEIDLAEIPRASHQAQAILNFNKQGERLRRVLGPVREVDVWIAKLQGLRASIAETAGYIPRSSHDSARQIQRLESRLKERRIRLEKKLVVAIEQRNRGFISAAEELDAAVDGRVMDDGTNAAHMILARFAEVAKDFPAFDEENLHEFRKRIKMVRYLAEMHASDRASAQIAAQLRKLQSAIGEWHDWQALALEVPRGHRMKEAAELLGTLAAESFESAIATSRSIMGKLLGEGSTPAEAVHGRRPPARSDHDSRDVAITKLA